MAGGALGAPLGSSEFAWECVQRQLTLVRGLTLYLGCSAELGALAGSVL